MEKSGVGLEDGARGPVEGHYEGVHKCEIDIWREGWEHALLRAVAEPWKVNELGGQALLFLYEEGQFKNLKPFLAAIV